MIHVFTRASPQSCLTLASSPMSCNMPFVQAKCREDMITSKLMKAQELLLSSLIDEGGRSDEEIPLISLKLTIN